MRGVTPILAAILVLISLVHQSNGDCYMHNPRGSNNRLNERSANRNNANRLFDSQNNNRGGYNTGDKTDDPFTEETEIYYMNYFQSGSVGRSFLTAEWTNQHGCGGSDNNDPHKLNCQIVIQYTCQAEPEAVNNDIAAGSDDTLDVLRDGKETNTQDYTAPDNLNENQNQYNNRRANSVSNNRGLHETFGYYDDCYVRERNSGLFLADQIINSGQFAGLGYAGARFTRQNPNANRRGYECPEERDYYPYWHPTPWRDVAVLVDDTDRCSYYQSESFNVKPKYLCREKFEGTEIYRDTSKWNNEAECIANAGEWLDFYNYLEIDEGRNQANCENDNNDQITRKWARPYPSITPSCLILLQEPDCQQAGWTRVNHLGNSRTGYPLNYTITLPYFLDQAPRRCVLRIRYNISTDDYDPWYTNSSYNEDRFNRIRSPVIQNPYVDVGSITNGALRLAINTAQFGRTFQDRSHVHMFIPRPTNAITPDTTVNMDTVDIYNVNVRGKRGNIVQVYPAVEYDFIPNRLYITENDIVHFQWTGSNTHNNQNPAGDGQAGDAGEGRGGTDRHNIVEIANADMNYPVPFHNSTLFKSAQVVWYDMSTYDEINLIPSLEESKKNLALLLSSVGYYQCFTGCATDSVENKETLNNLLDNAYASFSAPLLRFPAGSYNYICSRNNNFTNRSQKGLLVVRSTAPA
ncbi:Protein DD3-3-like [Oopsacas minuta]|uniref:Protein DD3-3-like n=1 Tax=Oopsacas minuta TaxID=111878 RepID=A0AAV7JDG2_9METZ|nr:Protein DD3-3-like [Oopsacas minuta]